MSKTEPGVHFYLFSCLSLAAISTAKCTGFNLCNVSAGRRRVHTNAAQSAVYTQLAHASASLQMFHAQHPSQAKGLPLPHLGSHVICNIPLGDFQMQKGSVQTQMSVTPL